MHKIDQSLLHEALTLLAELTAMRPQQHLVICGGSSLLAMGLVTRSTTSDVDVLARFEDSKLSIAAPLPDWLVEAAKKVQAELGLMNDWLNAVPSDESLFRLGLPEGMVSRLTTRDYGPSLRISYISRYDQIFFKLYAVDAAAGRHYKDLQDLKPTEEELRAAARWTRTQDASEGFLKILSQVLSSLGYEHLIEQL